MPQVEKNDSGAGLGLRMRFYYPAFIALVALLIIFFLVLTSSSLNPPFSPIGETLYYNETAQILFKGKYIPVIMPQELSQVARYTGLMVVRWQKIAGHDFQGLYYGDIGICRFWLYCCNPKKQHDCEVVALVMPTYETRDNGEMYGVYKWWVYENGLPVTASEIIVRERLFPYMGKI